MSDSVNASHGGPPSAPPKLPPSAPPPTAGPPPSAPPTGGPVFGQPLSRISPPGSALPEPVRQILQYLGSRVPAPAPADLFDPLPSSIASKPQELRTLYDSGAPSPLDTESDPRVVATLLLLFLRLLPHPVIPPKFFFTVMRLGAIASPWNRFRQLRILVCKLPAVSRKLIVALLTYLSSTKIDSSRIASTFGKSLLRPSMENDPAPLPVQATRVVAEMVEQAPYITITIAQPTISDPNAPPEQPNEFKLLGCALFDFKSDCTNFSFFFQNLLSSKLTEYFPSVLETVYKFSMRIQMNGWKGIYMA